MARHAGSDTTYNADMITFNVELSRQQERWLNRAIGVAYQGLENKDNHQYPSNYFLGAVIVKSGRPLAVGTNRVRNDPTNNKMPGNVYGIHAEMNALQELRGNDNSYSAAKGATIYIARITPGAHDVALARPCDNCYMELRRVGISNIIYTTSDDPMMAE